MRVLTIRLLVGGANIPTLPVAWEHLFRTLEQTVSPPQEAVLRDDDGAPVGYFALTDVSDTEHAAILASATALEGPAPAGSARPPP